MGKFAVVTGASSGIGQETAKILYEEGFELALISRRRYSLGVFTSDLEKTNGKKIHILPLDITKEEAVRSSLGLLPGIDVLVNSAGLNHPKPLNELTNYEREEIMNVNFHGACYCMEAALPKMSNNGYIVNILTQAINSPIPPKRHEQYYKAKMMLREAIGFLEALNKERGIRFVNIYPAFVRTDFFRHYPREFTDRFMNHVVEPGVVGEYIVDAIGNPNSKRDIDIPSFYWVLRVMTRFFPVLTGRLVQRYSC